SVLRRRPEIHVVDRPRAARPANRSAMRMVRMEDLGAAVNQAEFRGVAHVRTGNSRGGVTEGIGAVPHRLILETEILVLHVHIVDAERLTPIVDRTATRTIRIGQWIALRQEIALPIDRTERFVADLVIDQHELTEIRTGPVLNDRLP